MKDNNLELWNQVCETDPSITKRLTHGAKLTAICAQSQLKKATELWGPYGEKWHLSDLKWEYISNSKAEVVEVCLSAIFRAPNISFELSNDMAYRPGSETRKKLLTDLRSKALSTLGFNSDVFEGKFDDNRYVAEAKRKAAANNKAPQPPKRSKEQLQAAFEKKVESFKGQMSEDSYNMFIKIHSNGPNPGIKTITELEDQKNLIKDMQREVNINNA